jgi:photosystem II stability/assembly factor-like uncharacterized protein
MTMHDDGDELIGRRLGEALESEARHNVLPAGFAATLTDGLADRRGRWLSLVTLSALAVTAVLAVTGVAVVLGLRHPAPSAAPPTASPTSSALLGSPAPTPLPPGPDVQAAGLISPTDGWALVPTGPPTDPMRSSTLYFTADGGATWRSAAVPGPATGTGVLGVAFADTSRGWLATLDSTDPRSTVFDVWRTTDGGRTWQKAVLPEGANRSDTMGSVVFSILDPQHLFLLVQGGMPNGWVSDLYASADGGRTWSPDRMTGAGVTGAVAFADAEHGVIAGGAPGDRLFATADAGRSWERVTVPVPPGADPASTGMWSAPTFFDATHGALVANYGNGAGPMAFGVLVTHDAGASWALVFNASQTATNDVPVAFPGPTDWVAVLDDTTLLTTTDAGATWTRQPTVGLPAGPQSLQFADAQHLWALVPMSVCLGSKTDCSSRVGLYATSDGGRTWAALWPGKVG